MIYEIQNLKEARIFLKNSKQKVILSNPPGSTRYYGMRVIDHMFKQLKQEFGAQIQDIIIDAYDDYSAFVTARKLGYDRIKYLNINHNY